MRVGRPGGAPQAVSWPLRSTRPWGAAGATGLDRSVPQDPPISSLLTCHAALRCANSTLALLQAEVLLRQRSEEMLANLWKINVMVSSKHS